MRGHKMNYALAKTKSKKREKSTHAHTAYKQKHKQTIE